LHQEHFVKDVELFRSFEVNKH